MSMCYMNFKYPPPFKVRVLDIGFIKRGISILIRWYKTPLSIMSSAACFQSTQPPLRFFAWQLTKYYALLR